MSINYVLIFIIILIIAMMAIGYWRGAVRMGYFIFFMAASIFVAGILDSGVYRVLDFFGVDNAMYGITKNTVLADGPNADYTRMIEQINAQVSAQTDYVEKLHLPNDLKLSMLENNNSKVYEFFKADNFVEYIRWYNAHLLLCVISLVVAFIIAIIIVNALLHAAGITEHVSEYNKRSGFTGILLGLAAGFALVYLIFALSIFVSGTYFGTVFYNQIKSNSFLDFLYENNMLVKLFMTIKAPMWIHGK
ncbi:MAG: hypothetical protein IJM37_01300 [Lachnospiraceae bacterium]|nr:hypothetical protein [Lachnospiraceae bacterium]